MSLGHEIGLHFDPTLHNITNEADLDASIEKERKALEDIIENKIEMFSFHNTTPFSLSCKKDTYGGCKNVYSDFFVNNVEYTSDSNGYWRFRSWEQLLKEGHSVIQILTHPIWWKNDNQLPPYETVVQSCIERMAYEIDWYTSFFDNQSERGNRL